MGDYGKRVGLTKARCYRCKDQGQKTVYDKSGVHIARCRICGHSFKVKKK